MGEPSAAREGLPGGLVLALAIALLARALLPIAAWQTHGDQRAFLTQDSHEYLSLAESLATTGSYATDGQPELRRVPGYPALVAEAIGIHADLVQKRLHLRKVTP